MLRGAQHDVHHVISQMWYQTYPIPTAA